MDACENDRIAIAADIRGIATSLEDLADQMECATCDELGFILGDLLEQVYVLKAALKEFRALANNC